MSEKPINKTSTLLLESLKDPRKDAVWREFDARYRPVLTAFARQLGLSQADSEDVAQETLTEFVAAYREGKYDRSRGRLSSWIIGIARNLIADRRRVGFRRGENRGDSALADLRNRTRLSRVWEAQRKRAIFSRAVEVLRSSGKTAEKTFRAFELVAVRGVPAETAAEECGMTVDEVYVAKNRVTKRLREIVEELTKAYTEDR